MPTIDSDSDAGSPKRVYVPVRSSAPTPVASAKKEKANPAYVAAARERAAFAAATAIELRLLDWHWANLEYGCAAPLSRVCLSHWNQVRGARRRRRRCRA